MTFRFGDLSSVDESLSTNHQHRQKLSLSSQVDSNVENSNFSKILVDQASDGIVVRIGDRHQRDSMHRDKCPRNHHDNHFLDLFESSLDTRMTDFSSFSHDLDYDDPRYNTLAGGGSRSRGRGQGRGLPYMGRGENIAYQVHN